MFVASPRDPERFSLRLLLLHRKNAHSFEHLRTVNGVVYNAFGDAARALDLLHDDAHYALCLEGATFQVATELRALFSYMLAFCDIRDTQTLFDRFKASMAEDFVHRGYSQLDGETMVYYDISDRVSVLQCDLSDRITPPSNLRPELQAVPIDHDWQANKGTQLYTCLNLDQKRAADRILASIGVGEDNLHFIDGPGGSGKTYLFNTVYHILKGQGKAVICVAWTAIAASLLPEGRTASSTFKLNMRSGNRDCNIRRQDTYAIPLKEADAIIWDEVSMVSKFSLEAVDLLLQDLMCNNAPFGGEAVILGGDLRQVLPIIEHGRDSDMADACIKNSHLWRRFSCHRLSTNMRAAESGAFWCDFLMSVGNGDAEEDEFGRNELPTSIIIDGDLVDNVFGDQLTNADSLSERAILAPRNLDVHRINEEALDKMPGQPRLYRSIDEVVSDEQSDSEYGNEFLNSLAPAGLPPHTLRLKKDAIVMLLRNLDVRGGLCNGTRLIVTHFGRFVLGCRFASGERNKELILIPRIDNYTDKGVPFRLRRRQISIRLAFAMTINKAQGQSLNSVGIHLGVDVFSHGQLYVALSRARRIE